jgi:hypothetical protein
MALLIKRKVNTGNQHKKRKRMECKMAIGGVKRMNTSTEPHKCISPVPLLSTDFATSFDRPTLSIGCNPVVPMASSLATESCEKLNPTSRLSNQRSVVFSEMTTTHTAQTQYDRPRSMSLDFGNFMKPDFCEKAETICDQKNTLTPRTLSVLEDMVFAECPEDDAWLNAVVSPAPVASPWLAPISPGIGVLPMSWSSLVSMS